MSDVPWGVLLSGGLDSSLVASICARHISRRSTNFPKLHSFTIGLKGAPDLAAAKKVADSLGTIHHAYTYTLQEGADSIRDVIRCLETYDITTIRASTPMYLMARKIKAMGIKMVLSGEGADEVFGGYLYFHKCPNASQYAKGYKENLIVLLASCQPVSHNSMNICGVMQMGKRAKERLSALAVSRASAPGMYPDGHGLYLRVSSNGGRAWALRYMLDGHSRVAGVSTHETDCRA